MVVLKIIIIIKENKIAIMNILNGKNTVLDFFKDAINKKEYARAYYILTLILKAKENKKTSFKG